VSNEERAQQRWCEYYEKHFELERGMGSNSGEDLTTCVQTVKPYVEPSNEVDKEIAKVN
jgi:hypothetical protein